MCITPPKVKAPVVFDQIGTQQRQAEIAAQGQRKRMGAAADLLAGQDASRPSGNLFVQALTGA